MPGIGVKEVPTDADAGRKGMQLLEAVGREMAVAHAPAGAGESGRVDVDGHGSCSTQPLASRGLENGSSGGTRGAMPAPMRVMAHEIRHYPGFGHPRDLAPGWDVLDVWAHTQAELDALIAAAERKFWRVWYRRVQLKHEAVLYKPSGATAPWTPPPEDLAEGDTTR